MKINLILCLLLVTCLFSCEKKQHTFSIRNSEWENKLVTIAFNDSTCTVLVKSPITGSVDTLKSKFTILNDTIKFKTGDESITMKDLVIKGDSLVTMDNGKVKDYFLRK